MVPFDPPKVINRHDPVDWRHDPEAVNIMRPSIYGNPFRIGPDGNHAEVLEKFTAYAKKRFKEDAEYRKAVLDLEGKTLVCCCHPKSCHGDILVEIIRAWVESPRGWNLIDADDEGYRHVSPNNDLKPHDEVGTKCWCNPMIDTSCDLVVHNSMDRRELYETGERKPS